jgi:hypothetical protein
MRLSIIEKLQKLGHLEIRLFNNGLYSFWDTNLAIGDQIEMDERLKINGFIDICVKMPSFIKNYDLDNGDLAGLTQDFNNFIYEQVTQADGCDLFDDLRVSNSVSGVFNGFNLLNDYDLWDMQIIASGMYLKIDNDRSIDLMMSNNRMPMVNELGQDKLEYHPHYPKYAVSLNTMNLAYNKLTDIKVLFFNSYGEFLNSGYLAGQDFFDGEVMVLNGEHSNIVTDGFSPTASEYEEYHAAKAAKSEI